MQAFAISTMQRLFRAWKARLSVHYCRYETDDERLSHRPGDVELDDYKYLIEHFGSEAFKAKSERNKQNREKQITKHLCGTRSFAEVEESTVQLQKLVAQQQSEEVEHPMSPDEILSSVLGERPGYVRGKGYGKKPPKKSRTQQANVEASVSSAIDIVRQEMQAEMDKKSLEEREQIAADMKKDMEEELERKLEEERQHVHLEVDKKIQLQVDMKLQEHLVAFMTKMQQ